MQGGAASDRNSIKGECQGCKLMELLEKDANQLRIYFVSMFLDVLPIYISVYISVFDEIQAI